MKEITRLVTEQNQKELLENNYLVELDENDTNIVHAIIKAPHDSVYRHKFIRLDLKIPENYPHSPPDVTFINHDSVRIHPNMYESGKCCATILNTWGDNQFEKWTSSMGIETILITFLSFLDNNPYMYEPGGRDDPSYTVYVEYQSWISCLIRYIQYESTVLFRNMIFSYFLSNIDSIFSDLAILEEKYPYDVYYTRCFEIDRYTINYRRISNNLAHIINNTEFDDINIVSNFDNVISDDQDTCNICFEGYSEEGHPEGHKYTLPCNHSFHKNCLLEHINTNWKLCPMCRMEILEINNNTEATEANENALEETRENNIVGEIPIEPDQFIINPLTRRRIKRGGKTWRYLVDNGYLDE